MDVEWRDCGRPADPIFVMVLLDDELQHALDPDPVGAHHDRLGCAVLIKECRAQRLGVTGTELEDMADLYPALVAQRGAAAHARRAYGHEGDIGDLGRLPITTIKDIAQVVA